MATVTVRRTRTRKELDVQWQFIASLALLMGFGTNSAPAIANGTTAGRLKTTATCVFRINGREYSKAATDDLWNLSAETDTANDEYRAYWLYLSTAGAASFVAGANAATAAEALAALPVANGTHGIAGVYVAGPECDFSVGAFAAEGTLYDGIPEGVPIGVPGKTYIKPSQVNLVAA